MLASMFTADRPTVTVADAQAEIGDALNQLRSSGYGEDGQLPLPTGNARELCRYWRTRASSTRYRWRRTRANCSRVTPEPCHPKCGGHW
ncbi:hypothetical protein [Nocardia sp. NPDC059239]|uniref:hypothetical protein n=1 Tax=Nocardia sp. NPDC059239 TaxID=3346785 RepID=UPI00368A667D